MMLPDASPLPSPCIRHRAFSGVKRVWASSGTKTSPGAALPLPVSAKHNFGFRRIVGRNDFVMPADANRCQMRSHSHSMVNWIEFPLYLLSIPPALQIHPNRDTSKPKGEIRG